MKGREFFRHPDVRLPLIRPRNDSDFLGFMKARFAKYLSLIDQLDSSDPLASAVRQDKDLISWLCHHIQEAIEAYHSGWPGKAFACIEKAMDHEKMWTMVGTITSPTAGHPIWKELYRIRVAGPEGGQFTKADLFHVPFELRHLVKRQRYSIPGLPCLYLGASLYVCWEEMGRPPFDTVYTARYELNPKFGVTVLDFSVAPQGWVPILERVPEKDLPPRCLSSAATWPLMAACSIRRKYDDSPFTEEYIVPQLVLQWVTLQNHVQGIAYGANIETNFKLKQRWHLRMLAPLAFSR